MIGLSDVNELVRLSKDGGNILYAAAGCMVFVLGTISSVCLKAAIKSRRLNKRNEKAVKMQEVIVESLKQNEIAQKNRTEGTAVPLPKAPPPAPTAPTVDPIL